MFWQITHFFFFFATTVTYPSHCREQGDVLMFYLLIVGVNWDETSMVNRTLVSVMPQVLRKI